MVINSTGHSSLPQLSYGDVKEQLPPTNTLDFRNVPAAPTTTYTPLGVAQMILGLPRNASMLSNVAPTNPMPTTIPIVNKEKPITTKSYTLGVNAFGNLSTPEQQISWLHQSADIALQGVQAPGHTSPGCSRTRKQILPKDSDVPLLKFDDTPLTSKN